MQAKNIHIFSGKEASLRLAKQQETLQSLALCLPRTRDLVHQLFQQGQTDAEQTVSTEKAKRIQSKFDMGNGAVASIDEKIVAIANFESVGTWKQKPVFEICDVVTDPHYRDLGLSSAVRGRCMQEILAKSPNAYWLGCTKDEKLIGKYERWKKTGACEEIGGDDYEDTKNQGRGEPPITDNERAVAKGWYAGCRIFLVDLQKFTEAQNDEKSGGAT
jgi:hypothetical protein